MAAVMGTMLPTGLPAIAALPLIMVAAAVAGGVVGGTAGVLKSKWGAHEVITTIMLNFVVLALLNYLIATHFRVVDTLHTANIRSGAMPRMSAWLPSFHGSAANAVSLIAVVVTGVVWWYLFRTRAGFELRAVGLQPEAAEYGGVHVGRVWWRTMALAGAIAGVGGLNFVLGYKYYYEDGFANGAGFLGIAVAPRRA